MSLSPALQMSQRRALLFCLGFAAGVALWMLAENWANPALLPWLYLALFSFVASYAILALALCGPVSVPRALLGALVLALPFTALISLAGRRYDLATRVLDQPILISVSLLLLLVATPFLIVCLQDRRAWSNYAALFEAAWALTIRYLSAWIFVSLFWLMMFLSDALLTLVDVEIIEWIIDTQWLAFGLTGGVLGLAMAVVYELRTTVSPFLLLRLMRLLVLPVLGVVGLFLAAIPLRGLSQVFGEFSAAAILMSVALVMVTLIAVVLERDDARMRDSRTIALSTRLLALLLPLVTGLAAWSISLRVFAYGWTPDRVLAACVGAVLLAYGVLYALAILRRQGWEARIRRINVGLAVVTIAISAALLTPVLNADRIAANSQLARFLEGRLPLDQVPLWQMEHDWGRAGQAAIAELENNPEVQSSELSQRLRDLRASDSEWAFRNEVQGDTLEAVKARLVELLPVLPAGQVLEARELDGLKRYQLGPWLAGCRRPLDDGRPGCVLIIDQFDPQSSRQGLLLYRHAGGGDTVTAVHIELGEEGRARTGQIQVLASTGQPGLKTSAIGLILGGDYSVGPSSLNSLYVDDTEVMPRP